MKHFNEFGVGRKVFKILLCIIGGFVAIEAFILFLFWVLLGGGRIL